MAIPLQMAIDHESQLGTVSATHSAARAIASQLESNRALFEAVQHELAGGQHHDRRQLAGDSFHSMFELTCHPGQPLGSHCAYWDWMFFGFWLVLLIIVTIVVETAMHKLEEALTDLVLLQLAARA